LLRADLTEKPGADAYRLLASLLSAGGKVVTPTPGLFLISSSDGPACVAFGKAAITSFATHCDTPEDAICVVDAATRTTRNVPVSGLAEGCADTAIALGGQGLTPLLLRNLRP
jgi:hypothetical protein